MAHSEPGMIQNRRGGDFSVGGFDYSTEPQRDGSYTQQQLHRFLWDLRFEPEWRREAEVDNAFYDGDQRDVKSLRRMKELGLAPVIINMTAPAVDSVAGWEVITRADLKCEPETEQAYDIAMGLNIKLKEAQRLTEFNTKVGQQFKATLKTGVSWLEVGRNPDPFGYPYFCDVHTLARDLLRLPVAQAGPVRRPIYRPAQVVRFRRIDPVLPEARRQDPAGDRRLAAGLDQRMGRTWAYRPGRGPGDEPRPGAALHARGRRVAAAAARPDRPL